MTRKTDDALDCCKKCGEDFNDCECAEYRWITDMSIEHSRQCIAFGGWDGLALVVERARLAELLGYEKAADEIRAQLRLYGPPGSEPTICLADLEANGELERSSALFAVEISKAAVAHEVLSTSQFGDRKWSDETWHYIDVLLGADKKSIAKAERARKAAEKPWIMRSYFRDNGESVTETYEEFVKKSVKLQ